MNRKTIPRYRATRCSSGIVLPFPVNGKRKWKRLLRSIVLIVFPRAKSTEKHIKTNIFLLKNGFPAKTK